MEFITSHGTRAAGLPFSDAVRVGDVLYLSGALGNVPGKTELVGGGIEAQTRAMMENIARVLNANGLSFDDVFKCLVMMKDMSEWPAFNKIYVDYFKPDLHVEIHGPWLPMFDGSADGVVRLLKGYDYRIHLMDGHEVDLADVDCLQSAVDACPTAVPEATFAKAELQRLEKPAPK